MLLPEMRLLARAGRCCEAAGRPGRGRRARGSPHGVGRWEPPAGFRYPLLNFPGHRRRAQDELQEEVAECRLGAPRGDRRPERSAIQRPSAGGYLLLLFASGLAIGQSSTEPIQRLPEVKPLEAIARRPTDANRLGGRAREGWNLL
jgi:hypothetical protein